MGKKYLSVIVVPHTKTSTRTLSFSRRTLKILAGAGAVFVVALLVFAVDYISMNVLRQRYRVLTQETAAQKARIADYEKSIRQLQTTIANFENYAKKLNVMAGLKSPDVLTAPAGLGGGGSEGAGDIPAPDASTAVPQSLPQGSIQGLSQKARSVENNLSSLVSYFESQTLRLATTPSIMPTAGWLSSPYGMRNDPFTGNYQMHWGIDISTNEGNPIVATADGIVIKVQKDKYLGNNVTISHGNGITTIYGHMMDRKTRVVHEGQKVKRGDVIGYVGHTGKAVGPHVHYEIHVDGKPVNPYWYLLEE
jgi:murein DD-endopeptidase MepM/ murein hydrolase activator NlpD